MGNWCCAVTHNSEGRYVETLFKLNGNAERSYTEKTTMTICAYLRDCGENNKMTPIEDIANIVLLYYGSHAVVFQSDIFVRECGHSNYVGRWRKNSEVYMGKPRNVWYGPKGGKIFWWSGKYQAWWMEQGGASYYVESNNETSPPGGVPTQWKVWRPGSIGKGVKAPFPPPILDDVQ